MTTTINQMADAIRNTTGATEMIAGGYDAVDRVAAEWVDAGFSVRQAREWWTAGGFDADRCAELVRAGLTPEACGKIRIESDRSYAYDHSNCDIGTDEVILFCLAN